MARRLTEHAKKLKKLYATEDGRIKGNGIFAKYPLFWFQLFLSYKCTRRCNYCYSFNQVGEDNKMEMDEKTFFRLLEWIPAVWQVNNIKVNSIGFLGGEPLLRTDRIKKVMDSVYKNTDGMQGYLYTNGDTIDNVNWDDLEDIQWILMNITDIGIDELSRRMKIISERANVIGQTIVATIDDYNLERILDVTRFGIENRYRLRYQMDIYKVADNEYKKMVLKKYHELCDLLEKYVIKGYDVHTTFLLDKLIPSWDQESSPYPCGKGNATVFPDGSVGPCNREHSFKTGTIFDENPLKVLECDTFHYELTKTELPTECKECESRTTCQGGCPHDKMQLSGNNLGKSVVCEIHKGIIPRLRNIEKLKKDTGVAGSNEGKRTVMPN